MNDTIDGRYLVAELEMNITTGTMYINMLTKGTGLWDITNKKSQATR